MAEIAEKAGLRRTCLYRALAPEGNPDLATVAGVLKAMGLRLAVVPAAQTTAVRRKLARRRATTTSHRQRAAKRA